MRQKVLLRVRPGVEARTHPGLTTATADSWFGIPIGRSSPRSAGSSRVRSCA
ncbi:MULTISPECIES: hypothetical protein [unclassified Pseudonocardia]|uniref:hypothetical protein n=1 Tax=unclassified Pseudonocardia TaxID=2619320 RepID=UPI001438AE7A|nr:MULTISPECIES: hypothetical protein [unclassified Pseudonocardia]